MLAPLCAKRVDNTRSGGTIRPKSGAFVSTEVSAKSSRTLGEMYVFDHPSRFVPSPSSGNGSHGWRSQVLVRLEKSKF